MTAAPRYQRFWRTSQGLGLSVHNWRSTEVRIDPENIGFEGINSRPDRCGGGPSSDPQPTFEAAAEGRILYAWAESASRLSSLSQGATPSIGTRPFLTAAAVPGRYCRQADGGARLPSARLMVQAEGAGKSKP